MQMDMKNVKKAEGEVRSSTIQEFVRQWLVANGFQGLGEGNSSSHVKMKYIASVSSRYIELYENITGTPFVKADLNQIEQRIEQNIINYLTLR